MPLGKITLIQGDPGTGKTTFALAVASITSRGDNFPFSDTGTKNMPQNVIFLTADDGIADTIKPRLVKMNTDTSRIHTIIETDEMLSLSDERIEAAIYKHNAKLLILDPLQALREFLLTCIGQIM